VKIALAALPALAGVAFGGAVNGYMLVGHALSVTDSATSGVTLQA
jgi:hypothetical protein